MPLVPGPPSPRHLPSLTQSEPLQTPPAPHAPVLACMQPTLVPAYSRICCARLCAVSPSFSSSTNSHKLTPARLASSIYTGSQLSAFSAHVSNARRLTRSITAYTYL